MKTLVPLLFLVATSWSQPVPGLSWASRLATEGAPQEIRYGNGWYVGMLYSEGEEYWEYDEEMWGENYYTLYDNVVVRTQDGLSWTRHEISAGSRGQVRGLAHAGSTWLAVASDGQVYRSTNHAATWGEVGQLPAAVYEYSYGYEDEDGNWVEESYSYESRRYDPLHPVHLSGNTWLIVDGASGNVYRSTNNGGSWSEHGQTGQGMTFYDVTTGAGGMLVVVGESGQIATSSNGGVTWTARDSRTSATLVSVAFGNGRYVAVGDNRTILTSADGINWQSQPTGSRGPWLSAVAFGNGVFVRADNGSVSADGLVWVTPQWDGVYGTSVVYGQAGWILVSGQDDDVYQSVDGSVPLPWLDEEVTPPTPPSGEAGSLYNYQISSVDGADRYEVIGLPEGLTLNKSTGLISGAPLKAGDYDLIVYAGNQNGYGDYSMVSLTIYNQGAEPPLPGLSWASRWAGESSPVEIRYGNGWYVGMLYSGGGEYWEYDEEMWEESYYTLYDNVVVRTQDGLSWTRHEISVGSEGQVRGLAHAGSTWMAVDSAGQVYRSTNHGVTWTKLGLLPAAVYEDVEWVEDDEGNWVEESYTYEVRNYDPSDPLFMGDSTWLIGDGRSGKVYRSINGGTTWTEHGDTGYEWTFYDVVFGGGKLVAVGEYGLIATSSDGGATWEERESGTGNTLVSVAFGNGRYVAVGDNRTILTSADGMVWQQQPVGGGRRWLSAVAFGNGVFVRADNGSVSADGSIWSTPQRGWANGYSAAYGHAGWILVSGQDDDVYQSVDGSVPLPWLDEEATLPTPPNGEAGSLYNYQIPSVDGADRYEVIGLPEGLTLNKSTGLISGAPLKAGDYDLIVYAGNQNGYGGYGFLGLTLFQGGTGIGEVKANQTVGTLVGVGNRTFGAAPFEVTVPTASSGLPVVLNVRSGPAAISGNTVRLTGVGTVVLAANQAGNANYNAAAEVTTSFKVGKAGQTIGGIAAVGNRRFGAAPFAVRGPMASSGLPVVLSVKSGPATISGNMVRLTGVGTVVLAANQAGNANYNAAAEVTTRFNVSKANQKIRFTKLGSRKFKKNEKFTLSASATSKLSVVFKSSNPRVVRISGKTATIVGKGSVTITASQRGNANFRAAKAVRRNITIK